MENHDLDTYRKAAQEHGAATLVGDSVAANKAHDVATSMYRRLKEAGRVGELEGELSNPDPSVRLWASMHLLPILGEKSGAVLEKVSEEKSIIGFTAKITLREWRAGKLTF